MGLLDSITQKVEGEALENMVESQAKSYFSGSSDSSSSDDQKETSSDNKDSNDQSSSSSSSNNQYVSKIESFIGDDRVNQIKEKVGADNFAKAESAIESQIESRFK